MKKNQAKAGTQPPAAPANTGTELPEFSFLLITIFWSTVIAALAGWDGFHYYMAARANAETAARHSYGKDLTYRRWSTGHGGVYVPATPETQPNPYLAHIPERDVTTPSGRVLTLVNPAYMTRQVHEMADSTFGTRGHITSLKPIRPENNPDNWERRALEAFAAGADEWTSLETSGSETLFRLMRPMKVEEGCLKCHAAQGYQVGDIRGGLSVSIPWAPYREAILAELPFHILGYGGLWGLGLLGIGLSRQRLQHHLVRRRRTERELRRSETRYHSLFAKNHAVMLLTDPADGRIVDANPAACAFYGYDLKDLTELRISDFTVLPPEQVRSKNDRTWTQQSSSLEFSHRLAGGEVRDVQVSSGPIEVAGQPLLYSIVHDVTGRKQAEEEKEKLSEQLRQSQKMEAVGRLAGGVAHDFNNMLAVIIGYAEMARRRLDPSEPLYEEVEAIYKAGQRSAGLVRQLLAFAKKQTIAPRVLDLNEAIAQMLKMLKRLIGEDIDLLWRPAENLWPACMDPAQIDQILANLVVNARDAIVGNGRITIETDKAEFDEEYCRTHVDFLPGEYVVIGVSDDGCGMAKETLARLFEPFFTTKPLCSGTGLGLATVHGIVRQNHGFISVYSEPGKGTTFRIYLPRHLADKTIAAPPEKRVEDLTGTETVLLVEDEDILLAFGTKILTEMGYTVLAAALPGQAVKIADEYAGDIHLLMTDVIMPEMSGRDLARKLSAMRPEMKCLFISGYTADVIAHRGVLDPGVHFLQKPFSREMLATKLREAISG